MNKSLLLALVLVMGCKPGLGYEGVSDEDRKTIVCGRYTQGSALMHCFAGSNQYTCIVDHRSDFKGEGRTEVRVCRLTFTTPGVISGAEK